MNVRGHLAVSAAIAAPIAVVGHTPAALGVGVLAGVLPDMDLPHSTASRWAVAAALGLGAAALLGYVAYVWPLALGAVILALWAGGHRGPTHTWQAAVAAALLAGVGLLLLERAGAGTVRPETTVALITAVLSCYMGHLAADRTDVFRRRRRAGR